MSKKDKNESLEENLGTRVITSAGLDVSNNMITKGVKIFSQKGREKAVGLMDRSSKFFS